MKINLEFENARDMFEQLPRFAALISFSGQFASFTEKQGEASTKVQLNAPDLPIIEQPAPEQKTVHPTNSMTAEEAGQRIEKAYDVAEAVNALSEPAPEKAEPTPETKPEEKPVKDVDVRAALNQLIKAGKRDKVKEILSSFKADNFSGLNPDDYWLVLAMAQEALNDG